MAFVDFTIDVIKYLVFAVHVSEAVSAVDFPISVPRNCLNCLGQSGILVALLPQSWNSVLEKFREEFSAVTIRMTIQAVNFNIPLAISGLFGLVVLYHLLRFFFGPVWDNNSYFFIHEKYIYMNIYIHIFVYTFILPPFGIHNNHFIHMVPYSSKYANSSNRWLVVYVAGSMLIPKIGGSSAEVPNGPHQAIRRIEQIESWTIPVIGL